MKIILILAHDEHRCIGAQGTIPWYNPEDFKHFKECTTGFPIIMGRKTFISIGRPLPNRRNIVLSTEVFSADGIEVVKSIPTLVNELQSEWLEQVFVIGGAQIYKAFMDQGLADELWISHILGKHDGDTFFPVYDNDYKPYESKKFTTFDFVKYSRIKK